MNRNRGYLILEDGSAFSGKWGGGENRVGEVVFNTSHSGYEEIATDPSYYSQIIVMTSSQQGNYGVSDDFWESKNIWIEGFVCLDLQESKSNNFWKNRLIEAQKPVLSAVDTRRLVFSLREKGSPWGALVQADTKEEAQNLAQALICRAKKERVGKDWPYLVASKKTCLYKGDIPKGPRVAVIDFGCKTNIIRNLRARCSEVKVFSSRFEIKDLKAWDPDGILLSNGPGDPSFVEKSVETLSKLLGWKPMFGICMGHQILSLALGAKTFKMKFGHRGANHPVEDKVLNKVYMTSQNHGYVIDEKTLPKNIKITHRNLNDMTIAGISCEEKKCFGLQFHPESHPGPRDSEGLFDYFIEQLL